jgi:quercetin dioxygenase-like cupin family protein
MYAYILEGTLEVTYTVDGVEKTNVYKKGEAIMEGLNTPHNGVNNSDSPVKVLVVNIGSPDAKNSVKL